MNSYAGIFHFYNRGERGKREAFIGISASSSATTLLCYYSTTRQPIQVFSVLKNCVFVLIYVESIAIRIKRRKRKKSFPDMEKNFPYNKKSGKIVFVAFPDSFLCPSLFPAPAALFFKNRRQSFKPLLRPIAERAPPLEGD